MIFKSDDKAENLVDFNNKTITAPTIYQQANHQPTAIYLPLTDSNIEALRSGLPTDQEELSSTLIPTFDTPTSKSNILPEIHIFVTTT